MGNLSTILVEDTIYFCRNFYWFCLPLATIWLRSVQENPRHVIHNGLRPKFKTALQQAQLKQATIHSISQNPLHKKKVKRAHKHKLKTQNSPHITEFQSTSSSARIKSKRRQKCTFLFPMFHEISTSINRVANYHLKLFVQQKVKRLQSMLSENIHEATRSL